MKVSRKMIVGALVGALVLALGPTPVIVQAVSGSQAAGEAWVARYDGSGDWDVSYPAVVSPDGTRVYVAGKSPGSGTDSDYAAVAYDAATGVQSWAARYNGPANGWDGATALAVSPDGTRVYVTGSSTGVGTGGDYTTVAYDAATGTQLWVARYDGPASGYDGAGALAVSSDGKRLFVGGRSASVMLDDYATIAYDAETGAQLWSARYNGPGNDWDQIFALGVSPDGLRVYVTGGSWGGAVGTDVATIAYDATTGAQSWIIRYDGPGHATDQGYALTVSPDGARLYIVGWSAGASSKDDYLTIAYDAATGAQAWLDRYDGPAGLWDEATSVAVNRDGSRLYITGGSFGLASAYDYATIAYDAATGTQGWVARYDGPGHAWDEAHSIVVTPDGSRVFLTGQSIGAGTGWDFATVGYDTATGAQAWGARYDGSGHGWDEPASLAASPDGSRLYVTGESLGGASSFDYATVAYWTAGTCASGGNEVGPVSGRTHETIEPAAGPAADAVHTAGCTVMEPVGL